MRTKLLLALTVLLSITVKAQQVIVDSEMTPEELIEDVLFQGCIEISNVSSPINGNINGLNSFGYFQKSNSNFPFEDGLVLTTGNANSTGNSFNTTPLNEGETSWGSDPDLEEVLGVSSTMNTTVIEFDFITASNNISFNYILASEEYLNDYPCNYSDSFAFLIKPSDNSAPYTNITLVPDTDTPVSTQNIRPEIVGFCGALNQEYFDGFNVGDTNYNGRTAVLTAQTTIQPNVSYHIKLAIADQFDENFDSAVFIEGNTFSTQVDLGDVVNTCNDVYELNTGIDNSEAVFSWSFEGNPLPFTTPSITATESGTYSVSVSVPYASSICEIEDAVVVNLNGVEDSSPVTDLEVCEQTNNILPTTFDLTLKNEELSASVPFENATITYYISEEDALNNDNSITNYSGTTPTTIWAKIQDPISQCIAYNSFDLILNTPPVLLEPDNLLVCDDDNDGHAYFELSEAGNQATSYNSNLSISYYTSLGNAVDEQEAIESYYQNVSNPQTIYIKATNNDTGCSSITTVTLEIGTGPELLNSTLEIDACDPEANGYTTFNLNDQIDEIVANSENYTVEFYLSEINAINGEYPIIDPTNFSNTSQYEQIVYAKVINPETGCYTIATLYTYSAMIDSETNTSPYQICDDESGDGVEQFDLNNLEAYIVGELEDVSVTFFTSEEDQANNENALDKEQPYMNTSNPQTLYLLVQKEDACGMLKEINIEVTPYFSINNISSQTVCDTDGDAIASVTTNQFNDVISDGNNYNVVYFLTENDALDNTNPITEFVNTSNPQEIWATVSNSSGSCSDIIHFEIEVLPAPETNTVSDIYICDDDNDGLYTVNLTSVESQLLNNSNGVTVDYYTNQEDATAGTNAVENPSSFETSTTEIYAVTTSNTTGCESVQMFTIYVAFFPELTDNADFMLCEGDGNETEAFFLEDYDTTILNNEEGMFVTYFETATDAYNNTNAINKSSGYENTANPQTLYARRQSEFDNSCFAVDPITISVNSYPVFDDPQDLSLCDDISNDGFETFDLNLAIDEMNIDTSSYEVSFHVSQNDANSGTNELPLTFTNTVNPQTIWAKIATPEGCYEAVSFKLNVVHVGLINTPSPISYCDDDYNGYEYVDLTSDDVDVLMIRQNEISLTYYETEEAAINETNAIADPVHYQVNTNETTTVYIVATNNISGCSLYVPLEVTIYETPQFVEENNFNICQDNVSQIDLQTLNELTLENTEGVSVSYFTSLTNAESNTNAISNTYNISSVGVQTLYARATNSNGCFAIGEVNFQVFQNPIAYEAADLRTCTNEVVSEFDLTIQLTTILGTQDPSLFSVELFLSADEANTNTNAIENLVAYEAYDNETIYARVTNTQTGCYSISTFMIHLDPYPIIPITDDFVLCLNDPLIIADAYTGNDMDTYEWSTGATTPEIEITETGIYSVTVTSERGCATTKYFGVTESESASITNIETVSFSDNNTIMVTAEGIGNYMYSLDGGTPQTSNVFENVQIGYHHVEVVDINGCSGTVSTDIAVLGFPKYFTPNGDGVNDHWNVFGFETLKTSYVSIFDRYGKLLKIIKPGDAGWDGRLNGSELPSTDYWFKAEINDVDEPFEAQGHFTLKR
ncbi:gliding motility-associated C-terminal domain-containing protein [Pustulibacterium marinum]|uniref:Gliding motility-associated C-terminal domain-containing protein n=1 Tax=Pustulibacterium marinum TaxID=1224947 RepID=A0A1I7FLT1_9FLAO|nr:choice-of-anchor L domain-containing protein [Pustulibacterium marinum]SFU37098.1 gliding motility-associated C-terminal domain-containing protein [Pustulibacterium marinum]